MKTIIKSLQTLRSETLTSDAWSMLTQKKEFLTDVDHETLESMIIELSKKITDIMWELSDIESYAKIVNKYGKE